MTDSSGLAPAPPGSPREPVVVELREGGPARVVAWAAGWAALHRHPLSVLVAHPVQRHQLVQRRRLRHLARLRFDLVLAPLRRRHPELEIDEQVVWGDIDDALLARCGDAGAVVLARDGGAARTTKRLARLAGQARCPVIVLPDSIGQMPQPGPVVLGADASPEAWEAAEFAADLARSWSSDLVVVHAWEVPSLVRRRPGVVPSTDASVARERIAPVVSRLQELRPGLPIGSEVVRGDPVPVLLDQARSAAMVVVGSRGRGGEPGLLLGSVSRQLIDTSPVPVVIARTPSAGGAADRSADGRPVSLGADSAPAGGAGQG